MKGDYRKPPSSVVPELLVPTTRYGANVNKSQPATGAGISVGLRGTAGGECFTDDTAIIVN
jgi:hypothetical protein